MRGFSHYSADGFNDGWNGTGVTNTSTNLTYSFQNIGSMFQSDTSDLSVLSAIDGEYNTAAKDFIRSVFAYYSEIANITYTENTSQDLLGADIRLFSGTAAVLGEPTSTLGYAYQPYTAGTTTPYNTDYLGNFYFVNDSTGLDNLISPPFSAGFSDEKNTIAHELGHAMGLDHPFNSNAGSDAGFYDYNDASHTGVNYDGVITGGAHNTPLTDTVMETIMTYHNPNLGPVGDSTQGVFTQTNTPWQLGIYDIAALQNLYGANYASHAGDDQYTFNQNSPSYTTIWDGGGTDTITHVGSNSSLINLNEGTLSHVGTTPGWQLQVTDFSLDITSAEVTTPTNGTVSIDSGAHGFTFMANMAQGGFDGNLGVTLTFSDGSQSVIDIPNFNPAVTDESQYNLGIAFGVTIENAVGGSGVDTIIGNTAANQITGNGGNDTLTGGAGGDTFNFADIFGQDIITDFTHGEDILTFTSAMSGAISFAGDTLTVAGYGSILLSGITDMVMGTDYVIL